MKIRFIFYGRLVGEKNYKIFTRYVSQPLVTIYTGYKLKRYVHEFYLQNLRKKSNMQNY